MSSLNFYPTLNEYLFDLAEIQCDEYSFSYHDDKNVYPLSFDKEDGEYILTDSRAIWNVVDYNLSIKTRIKIENPIVLFGKKGIVPLHSKIFVALQWMSKASQKRDTIKCIEFDSNEEFVDEEISINIKKDRLRNNVKLQLIMGVGETGIAQQDELFLANTKGIILGTFNEGKVMLEGKSSEFPITCFEWGVNKPLWTLEYSSLDPVNDKFSVDNVNLKINVLHPKYKELNLDNLQEVSGLFKEVFSNAIIMLLYNLEKDNYLDLIEEGEDLVEGSICAAMHYFVRTFNIDLSSIEKIADSVKEGIDKIL